MKVITFDVSNAACSLAVCPNGNSMMIDCGSMSEKPCPVDLINAWRQPNGYLSGMRVWESNGNQYPLTMLDISHPDDDHVRNIQAVHEKLPPYVFSRRLIDEFPQTEQDTTHEYYKGLCNQYRDFTVPQPQWGFHENHLFQIPMSVLLASDVLRLKLRNNSSRVRLLSFSGVRILFCGDMETEGWDWLLANDATFSQEIAKGITILVASHHGHNSGFSSALFNIMGAPKLSVLSKGSEDGGETDVSSQYSAQSEGVNVRELGTGNVRKRSSVSTRANGNIFIEVGTDNYTVDIEKDL